MHVTNGIIIQIKRETAGNFQVTPRIMDQRKRSFKPLENEVAQYRRQTREEPTHLRTVEEGIQDSQIESSKLVDFFWVLLRIYSDTVPSWKGFNYLIHPYSNERVHEISYLPAINQSPTKLDTVLELLCQSKEKAEKIGLKETDVVLDQAIYAKACEVSR